MAAVPDLKSAGVLIYDAGLCPPMRILHLLSQHPESTGSGYYLQNILRQASAAGHENYLVAGLSGSQTPEIMGIDEDHCRFVRFERGGLDFKIPGMSDIMPYPSSRFGDLSQPQLQRYEEAFSKAITEAAATFAPDILHSHHLWLVSATARKLLPDLPMVTSCHSTDLRQSVKCPQLGERVLSPCREIDRVLALGEGQRQQIKNLYRIDCGRIDVVGGGFDKQLFQFKEKTVAQPVKLLYAGKFSFAKGLDCLLRSMLGLSDPEIHLYLAGSGTGDEERLCLELARQGAGQVTLLGRLSQPQLASWMAQAHLFVLPSFYEGLPLVLLEALACGCRLITTDLPGCRELLQGANPDLMEFVSLPELEQIDQPVAAELPLFESRLQQAILSMSDLVRRSPSPDADAVRPVTEPFSWEQVFARVNHSYRQAVCSRQA